MAVGAYIQMLEVFSLSVLEKHIPEHVISVILGLERYGDCAVYLWAELDDQGVRRVRGTIELDGKRYECALVRGVSENGVLLVMPLDDGSYTNIAIPVKGDDDERR